VPEKSSNWTISEANTVAFFTYGRVFRNLEGLYLLENNWSGREDSNLRPPGPGTRKAGTNLLATQSSEWCSNRLILAQSRQSWRNVNPQLQPQVSDMKLGLARQWPLSGRGFSETPK
jgi:hypothetical protein